MSMEFARKFRSDLDEVHQTLISVTTPACRCAVARGRVDSKADRWASARLSGKQSAEICARLIGRQVQRAKVFAGCVGRGARLHGTHLGETAELVGGGTRNSDRGCGSHSRGPASDKLHRGWRGAGDTAISDRRLCEPSALAREATDGWTEVVSVLLSMFRRKKARREAGLFCLP